MSGFDDIAAELAAFKARDLYRQRRRLEAPQGRELVVDGRRLLNFCSNDYLGLAADPRVAEAFRAGIQRWGTGAGASHLVCGHTAAHAELEEALADFTGRPRALLFSSGYAANVGTINALLSRGDAVFQDRLNHASLLDGGWVSRADFHWYRHRDTAQLEQKLAATAGGRRQLVVSDGTFSMDGDLAPLDSLVPISRAADAWLMIDDAHGIGVLGEQGRGLVDPARWTVADVPVLVGTLGKALGCYGAFVAGSETLIDYLIQRARNYIYTTALPPAVACATLQALAIARREGWRRERLAALIRRFRSGAAELGLEPAPSATPIQPLIVGESGAAMAFSRALQEQGLLVGAIRPPTVPKGTARLRITLTAAHDEADVDRLLTALDAAARRIRAA
ncbi:MAG: 8-amino-7-oxononanoate synthase [Gammaproteobacteria bacterium]|nr:MAG: 8-amino-7-oxononanoate synthase [Gammaproteobacteria bacterium]